MSEHPEAQHLQVPRTARYYVLGVPPREADEVWFVLHGYGQLARHFARPFRALLDGRRCVVAPEGLARFYLEGTGGRVGASWMTREDRLAEIDDYVAYLDALHEHLLGPEPQAHVHSLGFSQGAATATRWALFGERRVDRLTCWGSGVPDDLDLTAHRDDLARLGLTLVVGQGDTYVTPERLERHRAWLDEHDVPCRLVRYDGGHRIEEVVLERVAGLRTGERGSG